MLIIGFPAAGRRNNDSGGLNNGGSNGYYWSSSPNSSGSTNGGNLNFNSGGSVNPQNNYNRANGLIVRCVSELREGSKDKNVCASFLQIESVARLLKCALPQSD